jgi:hypothetical protein
MEVLYPILMVGVAVVILATMLTEIRALSRKPIWEQAAESHALFDLRTLKVTHVGVEGAAENAPYAGVERRTQSLPYVGVERRRANVANKEKAVAVAAETEKQRKVA